jgi:aryl-alcohol dehydrogenase-like predicted oxidoreductase
VDARVRLGRTGLSVSSLCFGTGYMGGSIPAGVRLLTRAFELGVTFWDTSDDYGTHPHVSRALREVGRDRVAVATKTYASTATGARRAVTKALRELGVEAVDIFLLHAVADVAIWRRVRRRARRAKGSTGSLPDRGS